MSSIINRMLIKDLLWTFIIAVVGVNSLLVLEPLIRFSKKTTGISMGFSNMSKLILLIQPKVLVFSLPIALVISIISTYGRLNIENELIVLKASGIKLKTLFVPAKILTLFVLIVAFFCAHLAGPKADKMLRITLNEIAKRNLLESIEPQVFFQSIQGLTLFVDKKDNSNVLRGIFIFQNTKPPQIITANTATWHKDNVVMLEEGQILLLNSSNIIEISFKQYRMALSFSPKIVALSRVSLSDVELLDKYKASGNKLFLIEFLRRSSLPLINLPLAILALLFSVKIQHGARLKGLMFTISTYGIFYIVLILTENFVLSNNTDFVYLPAVPILVLIFVSMLLYRRFDE